MKSSLLLPNRFKMIGWWIMIPATIAGVLVISSGYEAEWLNARVISIFSEEGGFFSDEIDYKFGPFAIMQANVTNTLVGVLFILGALMVAFSKERHEDEFIANLRLSSLLWSVWVHYILLLLAFLLIYGMSFFTVMVYNMFTVLIIFIIRFNYILFKSSKMATDEK